MNNNERKEFKKRIWSLDNGDLLLFHQVTLDRLILRMKEFEMEKEKIDLIAEEMHLRANKK